MLSLLIKISFAEATLAKQVSKQFGRAICRTKVSTVHKSNMLIDEANAHFKAAKLKGAKKLLPNELNYKKRNTQVQVGGKGRADIRIVNCFVTVFLSFSLLAFALAFPGFSARERGQQRREMPERLR